MTQESVLWYENNTMVVQYKEKFYHKLSSLFSHINVEEWLRARFWDLESSKQRDFLLQSDVSSLILRLTDENTVSQLNLLNQELKYFLDWNFKSLCHNQWEYIKWTKIRLTLHDNNPDNNVINHPDHTWEGMLWWGEKTPEEWNAVFSKAFEMLKEINYSFFMELQWMIQKIIPMNTSHGVHNSCTYRQCIGTLYLWYTIDTDFPELNIIEALIHESSHNKFNLIAQSETLYNNNSDQNYYSPYRPDARPLHGVLIWVHALVPAVFVLLQWIKKWMISDYRWKQKVVLYHIKNKLWYNVIKKFLLPTETWNLILNDMLEVMKQCDSIIQKYKLLQELDVSEIQGRAKKHFLEVKHNYPTVQY